MDIKFDYSKDVMVADGTEFPLKPLRKYLTANYPELVQGHFIKAIRSGGRTKFTFDWDTIYFKSKEYGHIKKYLNEIQ